MIGHGTTATHIPFFYKILSNSSALEIILLFRRNLHKSVLKDESDRIKIPRTEETKSTYFKGHRCNFNYQPSIVWTLEGSRSKKGKEWREKVAMGRRKFCGASLALQSSTRESFLTRSQHVTCNFVIWFTDTKDRSPAVFINHNLRGAPCVLVFPTPIATRHM